MLVRSHSYRVRQSSRLGAKMQRYGSLFQSSGENLVAIIINVPATNDVGLSESNSHRLETGIRPTGKKYTSNSCNGRTDENNDGRYKVSG